MTVMLSYMRLALVIGGTLLGLQMPVFVDQYGVILDARYSEARTAIGEFQRDADRYFDGDMEKLIVYYESTDDPVFRDGGESIGAIFSRYLTLEKALVDFRSGVVNAYWQAFVSPVDEVQEAARKHFAYSVKLTPNAIAVGLGAGLILSLLVELLLRLLLLPFTRPAVR